MKRIFSLIFAMLLVLTACGGTATMENTYQQITQQEAKVMMDTQYVIILDVREQSYIEDIFVTTPTPDTVHAEVKTQRLACDSGSAKHDVFCR